MILSAIRGLLSPNTKVREVGSSGLGQSNSLDVVIDHKKLHLVIVHRRIKFKETHDTAFMQQLHYFCRIKREMFPTIAFASDLSE